MKKLVFLIVVMFFAFNLTNAQKSVEISLKANNKGLILNKSDNLGLTIKTGVNKIKLSSKNTKQGNFVELSSEGLVKIYDVGKPNLPVFSKLIEVPIGAEVQVKVLSFDEQTFNLNNYGIKQKIIPAIASVSKSADYSDIVYQKNANIYTSKSFYVPTTAFYEESGILRDTRIGRIQINPFNYNPITNELKVLNNIVVEVSFKNADFSKTESLKQKYSSPFFGGAGTTLNKLNISSKALVTNAPVTYVIVSDVMFQSQLQDFVAWKKLKGFHVIEAYTNIIGNTTTEIKAYLQNLYENPEVGVNPPSFVLFVGDTPQIPAWAGTTNNSHISDLKYCEYTGDYLPEVIYGRFSARDSAQLQPQIDKTLEYEKYLMPDPTYLGEVLMVPGDDDSYDKTWGNGQINYGTDYYFNSNNNIYSHTFLQDPPPEIGGNAGVHDSIIANVNDGVAFANYTAHCSFDGWYSPSFSMNDASLLVNNHKYGLWIGNCCQSVKFEYDSCFGEVALRKDRGGAIGYIGGSDYTYWDEDYWWGVGLTSSIVANPTYDESGAGVYDGVFHNLANEINDISSWYPTQGQVKTAGNLAVESSTSGLKSYYWEIYHLMGDPSIMNYIGIPAAQIVSLSSDTLLIGSNSIQVSTTPYSYIAFTQDGQLIGVGMADLDGFAEISFSVLLTSSPVQLVVTAQNKIPYIEELIPVSATEPVVYVSADSLATDPVYGVTTGMTVVLKNYAVLSSGNDATNVVASLSSTDEYVTINDSVADYGTILAGTEREIIDAYNITFADNVPDLHKVSFDVLINADSGYTWNSAINIIAQAPVLEVDFDSINDVSTKNAMLISGNGNDILDPGETVDVVSLFSNTGHAVLVNAVSSISSTSPYVTVNTTSVDIISLGIDKSVKIPFNISVDANTPLGEMIDLTYTITSGLFSYEKTIYLKTGLIIEDFETAAFNAFPWEQGGDLSWKITNVNPYQGMYCAMSDTIKDNQSCELSIPILVENNDSISFYGKVSSESGYDFLQFYIDTDLIEQWSGEVDWANHTYPVIAGQHTFKWVYKKDNSESAGSDCAWLDYIVFPIYDKGVGVEILSKGIKIYPNPNNGNFYISIKESVPSEVLISNISGQIVYRDKFNNSLNEIKLNGISSGIYFVKIITDKEIISDKIIIK